MSKNYLNGTDWLVNGLHASSQQYTKNGNLFMVVLELATTPDESELKSLLLRFLNKIPILTGKPARNYFNLAPYWSYSKKTKIDKVPLIIETFESNEELYLKLQNFANTPFATNRNHVGFQLVKDTSKSFLAVKFDHRLFDGRGGEGFISLLQREWLNEDIYREEHLKDNPSNLTKWIDKFSSGKQVNRLLIKMLENGPPNNIKLSKKRTGLDNIFKHIMYDKTKSTELVATADKEAGLLMFMPYLLAKSIMTYHKILKARGEENITGDYIIPVTVDPRKAEDVYKNLFFNNWSILYFKISPKVADDMAALVDAIKKQMYENATSGFSKHLKNASYLMRILPLPIMKFFSSNILKGNVGSFSFSFIKDSLYTDDNFMGNKIINIFHMPKVPPHPGLGVFFSNYKGHLNAILSYTDSLLSEEEITKFQELIDKP